MFVAICAAIAAILVAAEAIVLGMLMEAGEYVCATVSMTGAGLILIGLGVIAVAIAEVTNKRRK